jgi:hypothetical protein
MLSNISSHSSYPWQSSGDCLAHTLGACSADRCLKSLGKGWQWFLTVLVLMAQGELTDSSKARFIDSMSAPGWVGCDTAAERATQDTRFINTEFTDSIMTNVTRFFS